MTKNFDHELREGLSDYSRKLSADTKELLNIYFQSIKTDTDELDEYEAACEAANKRFIRTCLTAVLGEMNEEERQGLKERPFNLSEIVRKAADKLDLSEEDKKIISNELEKTTPEANYLPSRMLTELRLFDHKSAMSRLEKALYEKLQENPEAAEAYSYLSFTS